MRNLDTILIAYITLEMLLRGCSSNKNEIFISQTANQDVERCGDSTTPCRTIGYALAKIHNRGVIVNIDAGKNPEFPYVYVIYRGIKINSSYIVFRKWEHKGDDSPSHKPILSKHSYRGKFVVFSNSIFFISIQFDSYSYSNWVLFETSPVKITIINCLCENNFEFSHSGGSSVSTKLRIFQSKIKVQVIGNFLDIHPSSSWFSLSYNIDSSPIFIQHLTIYNSQTENQNFNFNENLFRSIFISNCTFKHTNFNFSSYSTANIILHNSTFKSGRLKIADFKINITNCIFFNTPVLISHRDNTASADIYNTTFMSKAAGIKSPALIYTTKSDYSQKLILNRCTFQNNTSINRDIPSSLSIEDYQERKGSILLLNSAFEASRRSDKLISVLYDKEKINLQFLNTSVTCMDGNYAKITKIIYKNGNRITNLQTTCQACQRSTYRLSEQDFVNSNFIQNNRSCEPCPYNVICENGIIQSKGGYWGYADIEFGTMKKLVLIPCPAYYCCSSRKQCTSYNTCARFRRGRLCSECQPGFSTDASSKYQCRPNTQCNNAKIAFLLFAVFAIIFIVLLLYIKDIILFVKTLINSKATNNENEDGSPNDSNAQLPLGESFFQESLIRGDHRSRDQTVNTNVVNSENCNRKSSSNMISGSLKILFFFYQATTLIRVQSVDKIELVFPNFFDFISTLFNVKLDLTHTVMNVCILPDLNVLHVKLLKLGFVFIVFIFIMIFLVVSYAYKAVKNKNKIAIEGFEGQANGRGFKNTYVQIDDDVPSYRNPPFIVRVKCLYVQILLIGYASIATFSFDAIHCISINGESYLYTQASIQCYQPWQYGIIAFITLWVIPFVFALHIGSKLIYKCLLNTTQFLLMLSFPPIILLLLVKQKFRFKRMHLRTEEAMLAKHLLLVINEPFRESTEGDGSKLCWESVLILRRMLLVIAQTFIMSPIIKLYPMALLVFIFLSHHLRKKPFASSVLNILEEYSLRVLTSLIFVNMFWAYTRENDIMKDPTYNIFGKVAMFYEMFFLSLPFVLLTFYILYILCRLVVKLFKCIYFYLLYLFLYRYLYRIGILI